MVEDLVSDFVEIRYNGGQEVLMRLEIARKADDLINERVISLRQVRLQAGQTSGRRKLQGHQICSQPRFGRSPQENID